VVSDAGKCRYRVKQVFDSCYDDGKARSFPNPIAISGIIEISGTSLMAPARSIIVFSPGFWQTFAVLLENIGQER